MPHALDLKELPLTAFEEMFVRTDVPAYPMNCYSRMHFTGVLQREPFERALRFALERHPLMRSRLEDLDGRVRWVVQPDCLCLIDWQVAPFIEGLGQQSPFDLTRGTGMRAHVRIDGGRTELTIVVHHACADGAGSFQFIEEVLIGYAMACGEPGLEHRLAPLDPALLLRRGSYGYTRGKFLRALPDLAIGLLGVREYLGRRPVPLVPQDGAHPGLNEVNDRPAVTHHWFDMEETEVLRRAARRLGAGYTFNDLLTRDLFLAIEEWRREQNFAQDKDWMRLMVPTDLRAKADYAMPAANFFGAVFLDRQRADCADRASLLAGIHAQLDLIKRLRLGLLFVGAAMSGRWLPGGLRRHAPQHRGLGTAAFSNLGRLYARTPLPSREHCVVVGDLVLERVENVIPNFAGLDAAFCSTLYARRLNLLLHYNWRALSAAQARGLLQKWVARLRESAQEV